MIARRGWTVYRHILLGVALATAQGLGSQAQAQHTPDPYNIVGDYNSQYEPFMYAREPSPDGVFPNQSRLLQRNANFSANRFDSFLNDGGGFDEPGDEGFSTAPLRRGGAGTPYYRAFRRFDQDFKRVYRPNEKADESFYEQQRKRDDLYFQAMQKTDARKRSQLMREYNLQNLRAARGLSTVRNAPVTDRFEPRALGETAPEAEPAPETPAPTRRPSRVTPAPLPGRRGTGAGAAPSPSSILNRSRVGTTARDSRASSALGGTAEDDEEFPTSSSLLRRTPSDILDRSLLLDRARRATRPGLSSPAPRTPTLPR